MDKGGGLEIRRYILHAFESRCALGGLGGTVNSGVECWLVKPKVRGSKPLRSAEVGWGEEGGT